MHRLAAVVAGLALAAGSARALPAGLDAPPDAIVDLRTAEGIQLVRGEWRVRDADVVAVDHRAPGPDLRPSGAAIRTHDLEPKAGARDFDDDAWTVLAPAALEARRGRGRLSFVWYRTRVTVPERVGRFDPTGATVVLELVVDDYAEVWVDGRLPQVLGTAGGPAIAGWNSPNRLVVARDVRPGQQIQLAVLGVNGPLSEPPGNFVWIRSATLDFYAPARAAPGVPVPLAIERVDPALDALVPPGTALERLAGGFLFTEGPVWVPEGFLLFSDPNANRIYRWAPDLGVAVYRTKSGYAGPDVARYRQPGSNGLALDGEGRLLVCEHGNRRVTRLERNGTLTVLADRWQGRRLNSPNDLAYRRADGLLCFTDPPFGRPGGPADADRELDFSGVFCLRDGTLHLVSRELAGPNGLAFSPDGKHLYVDNWDEERKVVLRFETGADGLPAHGRPFFEVAVPGEHALDGLAVDERGNVWVAGPGGVWVVSPAGRHLGTFTAPEPVHNLAFGEADGRTLYLTARSGLYRLRVAAAGATP